MLQSTKLSEGVFYDKGTCKTQSKRISCKNDKINVELLNKDIEMENITTKVQVSNSLNK